MCTFRCTPGSRGTPVDHWQPSRLVTPTTVDCSHPQHGLVTLHLSMMAVTTSQRGSLLAFFLNALAMLQASPLRWNVPELVLSCMYMACQCLKIVLSLAFLIPRRSRSGFTIWMRLGSSSFTICPATSQMDAQRWPSRRQSSDTLNLTQNQFPSLQSGCIPTALNSWRPTCACT